MKKWEGRNIYDMTVMTPSPLRFQISNFKKGRPLEPFITESASSSPSPSLPTKLFVKRREGREERRGGGHGRVREAREGGGGHLRQGVQGPGQGHRQDRGDQEDAPPWGRRRRAPHHPPRGFPPPHALHRPPHRQVFVSIANPLLLLLTDPFARKKTSFEKVFV